jgi:predicted ferric reductase
MLIKYHHYIRRGWVLLFLLVLGVPVTSWVVHAPFSNALGSTFFTFKLLGQITGIIGAQLFAFALILSSRLRSLETMFGGLDKMYVIHHRVGVIGFSFLAVHPIILAFQYVSDSVSEMAAFLSPFGNTMPITFGICAILTMLLLLFLTFYGSVFMYPTLKLAHRFLGLAFFLGFLHIFFIPSSLSSDIILKVLLLTTALLSLIAFTYRTLLGKWLVKRYEYTVASVQDLGGQMTEINLVPSGEKKMYHMPGQFGMLSFSDVSSIVSDEEHPFTISSSGLDGRLRFSIKGLGDYTKAVSALAQGTHARIEGPFGEFSYVYGKPQQIWVAGGIGVTPFVSMAEHMLLLDTLPYTVDFFYSARSDADGVYKELFTKLAEKHSSFTFHFMPSDTKGYVTGELLVNEVHDVSVRDIFICGPPPMMAALTGQLVGLHVASSSIHSERFALLK